MRELVDLVVTSSSALSLLSLKRCAGGARAGVRRQQRHMGLPAYAAGGGGIGGSFPAPHSSNNDTTAVSSGAAAH